LGPDTPGGLRMVERLQKLDQIAPLAATFDTQRTLPHRRKALLGFEQGSNARGQPQPVESGGSEDDGGVVTFVELAQPRVDVAAQGLQLQTRKTCSDLAFASQAGGAHTRAIRKLR